MNILYFSFYNIRFGRGTSEEEAKKILTGEDAENMLWRNFKYRVFEIPKHGGTYAECYALLGKDFSSFSYKLFLISIYLEKYLGETNCQYITIAPKQVCAGADHLESIFQEVLDGGGKGVILRDPLSAYQPGRSAGYLKYNVPLFPCFSLYTFSS